MTAEVACDELAITQVLLRLERPVGCVSNHFLKQIADFPLEAFSFSENLQMSIDGTR